MRLLPLFLCAMVPLHAQHRDIDSASLQMALAKVVQDFDGRIGACVQAGERTACIRAEDRFALQSVMKLVVGVAILDSVDKSRRRLDAVVTIRKQDLSLFVQPLAE